MRFQVDSLVNPSLCSVPIRDATSEVKSTPFASVLKDSNQSTSVDFTSLRGIDEVCKN